jgi:hypothetical protein
MLTALVAIGYKIMAGVSDISYPSISKCIVALVGGFGSGKTEVSVNLAKYLASTQKKPVTIADFDLVNPVIMPQGGQTYADLPILLPEIKGAIKNQDGIVILDVGGDAQGSRALGSLAEVFIPGEYDMWMVLNSRRPQTSDKAGCLNTMRRIETTARLKFTGLVSNSHMIEETDIEVLMEGYRLAREVGDETGLPLAFISAKGSVLDGMDTSVFECPVFPLTRSMLKPWETETNPTDDLSNSQRT